MKVRTINHWPKREYGEDFRRAVREGMLRRLADPVFAAAHRERARATITRMNADPEFVRKAKEAKREYLRKRRACS